MKAKDIAAVIERFAPLDTQEKWDNAGLCIGSPEQEVHGVLVGFDCTPELVSEAIERGLDMIVTHHPLIFGGISKIDPDTFTGKAITLAVRHGIAVYAAHTNADKARGGVTGLMAARLGLKDVEPLVESSLAQVGWLEQPLSGERFVALVKERFGLKALRCSDPAGITVRKVGLCGGSGSEFIADALAAGADAYVTGDISYHRFFCDPGFMVLDIGHYESEVEIVDALFSLLKEKLHNFALCTSHKKEHNPIHYY